MQQTNKCYNYHMMENTHVPRCSCSRYLWAAENGGVKYMSKAGKTPQLFSLKSFKIILTFYQTWVGSLLRLRAALLQSPRNGGRRGLSIKEDKLTHLTHQRHLDLRIKDKQTQIPTGLKPHLDLRSGFSLLRRRVSM